jgi:hypothetical protein
LLRINETVEIDLSYLTCAEYQLFLDEQKAIGNTVRPAHWATSRFSPGTAKQAIVGVCARDAEGFCQWLSQREVIPGFQYRLPTIAEVEDHPITETQIGCWCSDGDDRVIRGIKPEQWEIWQEDLVNAMKVDLDVDRQLIRDRIRTRVRGLDLKLACAFDLNQPSDPGFEVNFETALDRIRALQRICVLDTTLYNSRAVNVATELISNLDYILSHTRIGRGEIIHTRDRIFALLPDLAHALVLAYTDEFADHPIVTYALDLTRILASTHEPGADLSYVNASKQICSHITDLNNTLTTQFPVSQEHKSIFDFADAFNLVFSRRNPNPQKQSNVIRSYLLSISILWNLLSELHRYLSKKGQKQWESFSKQCNTESDKFYKLYSFAVLMDQRYKGQIPAWEGIRIVRERIF